MNIRTPANRQLGSGVSSLSAMRHLTALLAMVICAGMAKGTHLIGGELYYTSLGSDVYEITLKVYRDCNPANNTNNQGFDPVVSVAAYTTGGSFVDSIQIAQGAVSMVPPVGNDPCSTPPASICVEQCVYTGTMFLPAGVGGYVLSYQRCCRSPIVQNLFQPNTQGLTCTVAVPEVALVGANSSPRFTSLPPIALCLGQNIVMANPATDPDGDQLVYDLAAPFTGGSTITPIPLPPGPPPYNSVSWNTGYSVANMIDATPALAVDPDNGTITLTPTLLGSYVVGLRVSEYRDGVQLSQVVRDVRFDVVPCTTLLNSIIADQQASSICSGLTMDFENNSTNSSFYHWDFGVPGALTDTSAEDEPTFTYPQAGTYTVTLIANPGWPCADTSTNTFAVANPVTVAFDPPPITCIDEQPVTLSAYGDFTAAANVHWDLGSGSSPNVDQHTAHATFTGLGAHAVQVTVEENGCSAAFTDSVILYPRPVPRFTADSAGCLPYNAQFTDSSDAWTSLRYAWEFGDGGTSTERNPQHTYTDAGYYNVRLTIMSDSGCIATESLFKPALVQVWPQPHAAFMVEPSVTTVLEPTVTITDFSSGTYAWDFEVEGQHFDSTRFTYTFPDAGWYIVHLTATSGLGCSDTTSVPVFVGGHLFYAPTACTPNADGMNDLWKPSVIGARKYKLDVFDRWGNTVFSTTDTEEAWDPAVYPVGIYAYKAWLTEWGPLEKEYNGSFVLVR